MVIFDSSSKISPSPPSPKAQLDERNNTILISPTTQQNVLTDNILAPTTQPRESTVDSASKEVNNDIPNTPNAGSKDDQDSSTTDTKDAALPNLPLNEQGNILTLSSLLPILTEVALSEIAEEFKGKGREELLDIQKKT